MVTIMSFAPRVLVIFVSAGCVNCADGDLNVSLKNCVKSEWFMMSCYFMWRKGSSSP